MVMMQYKWGNVEPKFTLKRHILTTNSDGTLVGRSLCGLLLDWSKKPLLELDPVELEPCPKCVKFGKSKGIEGL